MARPSKYTKKLASELCARIAEGESLRSICLDDDMPHRTTVMDWNDSDKEGFSDHYEKACQSRLMYHADIILDIADDGTNDWMERKDQNDEVVGWRENGESVARSRLRVDARKWVLSKLVPKYSDRADAPQDGINELAKAMLQMADRLPN